MAAQQTDEGVNRSDPHQSPAVTASPRGGSLFFYLGVISVVRSTPAAWLACAITLGSAAFL